MLEDTYSWNAWPRRPASRTARLEVISNVVCYPVLRCVAAQLRYSAEHLSRLQIIQSLRRAGPNIGLSEIRILFQHLKPEQIQSLASGSITAVVHAIDPSDASPDEIDPSWKLLLMTIMSPEGNRLGSVRDKAHRRGATCLLLRNVSGVALPASPSKVEGWQRITITPDIELSVRVEFDANHLAMFRELANLLRHLLQHTDAITRKGGE